jgi:hypothetical protein
MTKRMIGLAVGVALVVAVRLAARRTLASCKQCHEIFRK